MWRKKLKIMATAELHWHIFCKLEDQRVKDVEDKCTSVPEGKIEEVGVGHIESMSNRRLSDFTFFLLFWLGMRMMVCG